MAFSMVWLLYGLPYHFHPTIHSITSDKLFQRLGLYRPGMVPLSLYLSNKFPDSYDATSRGTMLKLE